MNISKISNGISNGIQQTAKKTETMSAPKKAILKVASSLETLANEKRMLVASKKAAKTTKKIQKLEGKMRHADGKQLQKLEEKIHDTRIELGALKCKAGEPIIITSAKDSGKVLMPPPPAVPTMPPVLTQKEKEAIDINEAFRAMREYADTL